jgi:hypothetical protein
MCTIRNSKLGVKVRIPNAPNAKDAPNYEAGLSLEI